MAEIKANIGFKLELKELSNSSLNECMQCGTCTAVCSLSPIERPFPRKEMIWAGWGLKDKLVGNGDVWLCHQCGDCSTYCPRGVKPSDVLAAIRQISYRHYAKPRFMGEILSKPQGLPVSILIPVVVITIILMMAGTFRIPEGEVLYSKFFPHAWLNGSFTLITVYFYGLWVTGLRQFWKDLKKGSPDSKASKGFIKSLFILIRSKIIFHSEFGKCKTQRSRQTAHILMFYGFILLL
ncbi:MAG: 4Fe-4S dicluster domain-containing protein, partial [Bacteroidales bacterium]|nr:4Fe-4S dicluster domain-containing protein [Bacteroidales bacterium]